VLLHEESCWRRSDVQATNRGHFSPYLQRRIDEAGRAADAAE
jgi:hypothetical protein